MEDNEVPKNFGLILNKVKANIKKDNQTKILALYLGIAFVVSFLFLVSLAPQIGEKLGKLSVKKQGQESKAVNIPSPVTRTPPAGSKYPPCFVDPQNPSSGYGDVDGNGLVNLDDVQIILKYLQGQPGGNMANSDRKVNTDVNRDGQITAVDALLIQRYTQGYIHTFPAVCNNLNSR